MSPKKHLIKIWLKHISKNLNSAILFHVLCWNGLGMPFPLPKMIFFFHCLSLWSYTTNSFFQFQPTCCFLSKVFPNSLMFHYFFLSLNPQNPEHPTNGIYAPVCLILCAYMLLHLDKVSFYFHLCIWRFQYIEIYVFIMCSVNVEWKTIENRANEWVNKYVPKKKYKQMEFSERHVTVLFETVLGKYYIYAWETHRRI